jgi:hypothetical protein
MKHQLLLERLRIQSIIQRLRREHGDDITLDLIRHALELELRLGQPVK